jgi:mRNA-degrading endonuclease HigB of HigAB toxin-antitoxin module
LFEIRDSVANGDVPLKYDTLFNVNCRTGVYVDTQDIKGIIVGDINGSKYGHYGPMKSSQKVAFTNSSVKQLNSNEYYEVPVKVTSDVSLGAMSLIIKFPQDLVEIAGVRLSNYNYNELYYDVNGNELRIVWVQDFYNSMNLKQGDNLFTIKVKTTDNFKAGDVIRFDVAQDLTCELADPQGEVIEHSILSIPRIEAISNSTVQSLDNESVSLDVYPNPASTFVKVNFSINNDELVNISLYNSLGEIVTNIDNTIVAKGNHTSTIDVSNFETGVYYVKMILSNNSVIIKKVVISR